MSAAVAEMLHTIQDRPHPFLLENKIRNASKDVQYVTPDAIRKRQRKALSPEVISEAVVCIDPRETVLASSSREVLENLYRVGAQSPQRHAGMALVDTVRHSPHIRTVAFMGPPGAGKTTAIEQFVEELFTRAEEEISVKIVSFDPAFQRMIKYMPREFWDGVHWKFINDSLILTSKSKRKRNLAGRREGPAREIELLEVPFVGSRNTSDRGRSFIEKRWEEIRNSEKPESMLFVPFAPVATTTARSTSFRDEMAKASGVPQQLAILAKYGIELTQNIIKKTGHKIQELISDLIHQILQSANKKQQLLVAQDVQKAMRSELPTLHPSFLKNFILLPEELELRISKDDAYHVRRYIFYWEKILDEMGVPSSQRHIMINPPLSRLHRTRLKKK